jgi:hypothetical protein
MSALKGKSRSRSNSEKRKIFLLLLKHPEYAGAFRWTDPRNPGYGRRWTRTDLDLFISMGGKPGATLTSHKA